MLISSSASIAASSIVESDVFIGPHVVIGPFCIISAGVQIGEGTIISSHVVINGNTTIGSYNQIGTGSSIGEISQDLKYAGEPAGLEIGHRNKIGRHATLHRGTAQGGGITRIGDDNHFQRGVHIGHDCQVGNAIFIGENSGLAGHVMLADEVHIDALCAVHQFCIIGAGARLLAGSCVVQDVPPYVQAGGNRASPRGINEGANGFSQADPGEREIVRYLYDLLYHRQVAAGKVRQEIRRLSAEYPLLHHFNEFFLRSVRGIVR